MLIEVVYCQPVKRDVPKCRLAIERPGAETLHGRELSRPIVMSDVLT